MVTETSDIFQKTQWTVVLNAREKDQNIAFQALTDLCKTYWYPLYVFARHQGKDTFVAEDLVQSFFAKILANPQSLRRVDPEKGKFRAYLLASFKMFMFEKNRYDQTQKRGGKEAVIELDALTAEERYKTESLSDTNENKIYDRIWATEIIKKVSLELQKEYENRGQLQHFKVMSQYLLSLNCDYKEMAERIGTNYNTVRVIFCRFKKRWRELLYREVSQTIDSEEKEDIEKEIYYLISCLI